MARSGYQAVGSRNPPVTGTRCTYVNSEGVVCDVFPSWLVPGKKNERRCVEHKGK